MEFPRGSKELLSGTFAGVVGTIFGHPLDTIKVRLQTQSQYKNAIDCARQVFKTEGIAKGFYRGLVPPLISLTFLNALAFASVGQCQQGFRHINVLRGQKADLQNYQFFVAGGVTGAFAGIFSTPFDMVKTRMQIDNLTGKNYSGSFNCATTITKLYGIRTLYASFGINSVREVAFCSIYFGFYEHLKRGLTNLFKPTPAPPTTSISSTTVSRRDSQSQLAILIAGGSSGALAWLISFPLDCIRVRIQSQPLAQIYEGTTKEGTIAAAKQIFAARGLGGFYSGIGPSIVRAFIVSSTRFSAYEFAFQMLSSLEK